MDDFTKEDYVYALSELYIELLEERKAARQAQRMLVEERANVSRLSARVRELEEKYGKTAK